MILLGTILVFMQLQACLSEKYEYLSTEHPVALYRNPKFLKFGNLTSHRYNRRDPMYYVGLHFEVLHLWGHNATASFYFLEWLTNQYKPSFVEMHFGFCDLVKYDNFFGAALRQGRLLGPCPYPAGIYHLYNMTVPIKQIPRNFPFRKGRIICNITSIATKELVASGSIDMEIKQFNTNRIKAKP